MNRFESELTRLFLLPPPEGSAAVPAGAVRAALLELSRPARWGELATVWQGVQADLDLPAPAIAVSGVDGMQLWFSFAEPVAASQAVALLKALRQRYLADVATDRVRMAVSPDHLPAKEVRTGCWSAFVAPDLAPIFSDEPWLDTPPSPEGQADVLVRLRSITPPAFRAALARLDEHLNPPGAEALLQPEQAKSAGAAAAAGTHQAAASTGLAGAAVHTSAREFLLAVMNDAGVDMALRIEAAKALLPEER
ncbi:MAG: hypothetical protein CFE46_11805 [Burkholderiales bacterium PBB6]|nr:MAG: hypothetical protein CFE46_11805 [Burkholderiales bacterium PBB6]